MFKFLEFTVDEYFLCSPITWKENAEFLKTDKPKRKGWEFIKECNEGKKRLTARYRIGGGFGVFIHVNFRENEKYPLLMDADLTYHYAGSHVETALFQTYFNTENHKHRKKYRVDDRNYKNCVVCCSDTMNTLKRFIEEIITDLPNYRDGRTFQFSEVVENVKRVVNNHIRELSCF